MTHPQPSDRDVNRAIRSWLHEDRHEDASRVAGAVLDRLEATSGRRATWWPAQRTASMNRIVTFGLAAAAVVIAIFVGAQVFGSPDGGPNVGADPTPTATPEPTPAPSTARPIDFATLRQGSRLEPGDYAFTHLAGVRVIFSAGPLWERNIPNWMVWSIDDDKATMGVSTVANVVVDPCRPDLGFRDPPVGPSVEDLVAALGTVPGLTFSDPVDVTQDGYSGVRLDYVPPDDLNNCLDDMGEASLLSIDGAVPSNASHIGAPNGEDPFSLYIYDVGGIRVVVAASPTESRADELEELLASIRFEEP